MFCSRASSCLLGTLFVVMLSNAAWAQETIRVSKAPDTVVDVKLSDESTLKLKLCEERIELQTKYGKLSIPLNEIRKIEFGHRVTEEMGKQIDLAIAELGNPQFRKREEAGVTLLSFREKAYPALVNASQSKDAEVSKRAEELIEKLKTMVPDNKLNIPDHDVIVTDDSKISGKILCHQLKAKSFTFGELNLILADTTSMAIVGTIDEKELANALPDPGAMTAYQRDIGKTYLFKVTGSTTGQLWGTEMYTLDSNLSTAAVHMGIVKPGQTGYVRVTILGPTANFNGTNRNGLTSANYVNYPGAYRIHAKKSD